MSLVPERTLIIAEAGVNHNGSLERALALVDAAAAAGADVVKFQTFRTECVVSRTAPRAEYQVRNTGEDETQFEMIKKLELDQAMHEALIARCEAQGIRFLSTPFDTESVTLLADTLKVPMLKVPSGEITNAPLLLSIARTGLPVLVSTGMCTLADVEDALGVLAYGWGPATEPPGLPAFRAAFASDAGQALLSRRVTLFHCTTEYPAPFADVNLRAMDTLRAAFGLPVGYSDHTAGIAVSLAAVARGARVIEKHFTLDRNLPGPDHRASLEPDELAAMVTGIRQIEAALGTGGKRPAPSELKNQAIARKSLRADRPISPGEPFTEANLTAKRPGTGISPMRHWELLGRPASRAYAPDDEIEP